MDDFPLLFDIVVAFINFICRLKAEELEAIRNPAPFSSGH